MTFWQKGSNSLPNSILDLVQLYKLKEFADKVYCISPKKSTLPESSLCAPPPPPPPPHTHTHTKKEKKKTL